MTSTQYRNPAHRKGTGVPDYVTLNEDAATAYNAWLDMRNVRYHNEDPTVDMEQVEQIISDGGTLGEYLRLAVADAATRPLAIGAELGNRWGILQALSRRQAEPQPVAPIAVDATDTCWHNVPFTADCAACDA